MNTLQTQKYPHWIDYTIEYNPIGVLDILRLYGYPEPMSENEFYQTTFKFINEYGNDALDSLKPVHPDYDMLVTSPAQQPAVIKQPETIQQPIIKNNTVGNSITTEDKDFVKKAVTIGLVIIGVVQILKVLNRAN